MIKGKKQQGFTIVELMVSNIIFSLVLLAAMAAMVQIGRLYYKGIITSRTQEVTRNISENISQGIQFSNNDVKETAGGFFCIGPIRYTYIEDAKLGDVEHVLWRDVPNGGCVGVVGIAANGHMGEDDPCGDPSYNCTEGKELMSANMRITNLYVGAIPTTKLYKIDVSLAYGDDDLIETVAGREVCKGSTIGTEFCAISELSTSVLRRVQ